MSHTLTEDLMRVPRFVNVLAGLIVVLFLTLPIAPAAFGQDSTLVEVMVPTDTSLVEAVPEIPSNLRDLLTHYQLALTTVLASLLIYGLSRIKAFSERQDRIKTMAVFAAAIIISGLLKWVGGTLSADLAGIISVGLTGLVGGATGVGVFKMAKSQPGNP